MHSTREGIHRELREKYPSLTVEIHLVSPSATINRGQNSASVFQTTRKVIKLDTFSGLHQRKNWNPLRDWTEMPDAADIVEISGSHLLFIRYWTFFEIYVFIDRSRWYRKNPLISKCNLECRYKSVVSGDSCPNKRFEAIPHYIYSSDPWFLQNYPYMHRFRFILSAIIIEGVTKTQKTWA
jgi:hypothetical protein